MSNLTEREIELMEELKVARIDIERLQNDKHMLQRELGSFRLADIVEAQMDGNPYLKSGDIRD